MTTQFKVGQTYYTRSICDHNVVHAFTATKRTAKTVTFKDKQGQHRTNRITVDNRAGMLVECVKPLGSYSMAPMVNATDTKRLLADWEKPASEQYTLVAICTDGRQLVGHGYDSWQAVERAVAERLSGPTQVRAFAYVSSSAEQYTVTTLDNSQLDDIRTKYGVRS